MTTMADEKIPHRLMNALEKISRERFNQQQEWGNQSAHPDAVWFAILAEEVGEVAQALLHDEFGGKAAGTLEAELIQVAAVATAWLEAIEQRGISKLGL